MHSPAHPGKILKEMYIAPLGVTVTKVADALGVTRKHVSAIVNGRAPVTPDMAVRLAGVFGTEPEIWVNLQAQYDLWLVRQQAKPKLSRCMRQPDSKNDAGNAHARGRGGR
jgi:addiction module HigA family antidote